MTFPDPPAPILMQGRVEPPTGHRVERDRTTPGAGAPTPARASGYAGIVQISAQHPPEISTLKAPSAAFYRVRAPRPPGTTAICATRRGLCRYPEDTSRFMPAGFTGNDRDPGSQGLLVGPSGQATESRPRPRRLSAALNWRFNQGRANLP